MCQTYGPDLSGDGFGMTGYAAPPYNRFRATLPHGRLPPGAVIRIDAPATEADLRWTAAAVLGRYPATALLGTFDPVLDVDAVARLGGTAGQIGLPLIASRELRADAWREAVTRPELIPAAFGFWLPIVVPRLSDEQLMSMARTALREIISMTEPAVAEQRRERINVKQLAALGGVNERQLRLQFRSQRLGTPRAWLKLLRLIACAVWLQRRRDLSLTTFAIRIGLPDSAALTHLFSDAVGVTPSFVRERTGWRWIAIRWLQRQQGLLS